MAGEECDFETLEAMLNDDFEKDENLAAAVPDKSDPSLRHEVNYLDNEGDLVTTNKQGFTNKVTSNHVLVKINQNSDQSEDLQSYQKNTEENKREFQDCDKVEHGSDDESDDDELDRLVMNTHRSVVQTKDFGSRESDSIESSGPIRGSSKKELEHCINAHPTIHYATTSTAHNREDTKGMNMLEMKEKLRLMQEQVKMLKQQVQTSEKQDVAKYFDNHQTQEKKQATDSSKKLKEMDKNPFFDDFVTSSSQEDIKSSRNVSDDNTQHARLDQDLFGSEDSELEEEYKQLSEQGKEIKKKLDSGSSDRVAHTPKFDLDKIKVKQQTWKPKHKQPINPDYSVTTGTRVRNEKQNIPSENFCGIKIIKPKISSSMFKTKIADRAVIKMSHLLSQLKSVVLQDNWITVGVIVQKSETRKASNGKNFIICKLSDLDDCDKPVSLFLFGDAYVQLWKTVVGTVIGILNPDIMKDNEKYKSNEASISVSHPGKVLEIGVSKDYGTCNSMTKAGKKCTAFVNRSKGEFCTYHVQQAYRKSSSQRSELQTSYTGAAPKSYDRKLFGNSNNGEFFYQGETFSLSKGKQKKQNKVSLTLLKQNSVTNPGLKNKVSTVTIHSLLPEDEKSLKELNVRHMKKINEQQKEFMETLSKPTPGSMQLIASMKRSEINQKEKEHGEQKVQSIKVSDFLKQSKQEMQKAINSSKLRSSISNCSDGPQLGRGFLPGSDILFDSPPAKQPLRNSATNGREVSQAIAKKKAISQVLAKGGIKKEDPNALRKTKSLEERSIVKKRLQDQIAEDTREEMQNVEPPKKKSRVLGDIDLKSDEFQKLFKMKSKHSSLADQAEAERQEKYFETLEKNEQMEEKMASITEMKCPVITCKQCGYSSQFQSQFCKEQHHEVQRHEGIKRFFQCKDCNRRTVTVCRYPNKPCQ